MQTIKKLMLTLVAVAALSAGATAQGTPSVKEFAVPESWHDDQTAVSADDLPGFAEVTDAVALTIPAPSNEGYYFLFYGLDGERFKVFIFQNGVRVADVPSTLSGPRGGFYSEYQSGRFKIYYTAASSPITLNGTADTATMLMPNADMTVSYELVRDMGYQVLVDLAEDSVRLSYDGEAYILAGGMTEGDLMNLFLVSDNISGTAAPMTFGDEGDYTLDFYLADDNGQPTGEAVSVDQLQPGRYVAVATGRGRYDGTAASPVLTFYERYTLTIAPADAFSADKLQTVTVGGQPVTLDATGTATLPADPGTEVVLTAQRGYVFAEPVSEPITVTITPSDFQLFGSFTKDGVTVTPGNISGSSIEDGGSFSTTLGTFTSIVVSCQYTDAYGEGWSINYDSSMGTWTGNASTVQFSNGFSYVDEIVCTIQPAN